MNPFFSSECDELKKVTGITSCNCVDSGPSIISIVGRSFENQINKACDIIGEHYDEWGLDQGFQMVGLSQGGLVARGVLQTCKHAKDKMVGLFTFGGPHQGVAAVPHTGTGFISNTLNSVVNKIIYTSAVQSLVGPAGYYHRLDDNDAYVNSGCIVSRLNNVKEINAEYKARISQLKKYVMVMFSKDTMIEPKETAHFGFWIDNTKSATKKVEDLPEWKNLGLDAIKDNIKYEICEGEHLHIGDGFTRILYPNLL